MGKDKMKDQYNFSKWKYLQEGDIIDIIAPSSGVPTDNLQEYYSKVKDLFFRHGLVARINEDLIVIENDPFSANSLNYRKDHFISCLTNKESKAVWAIRGGYGAAKILPFLEKLDLPQTNKLLLGFSDITALHLYFNKNWKFASLHAPVVNQALVNEKFMDEILALITGKKQMIDFNNLKALNEFAKEQVSISATIIGGNLSLIQTSLATSWEIDSEGKILFIEDVGEQGYKLDRMLNHLLQAGIFAKAKAVIFGQFNPPKDIVPDLCEVAIENFAKELQIPAISLPLIGHSFVDNSPLPFGALCDLTLGDNILLKCSTGGK